MSMAYFKPSGQVDDFVVHEAAHIFHNCKRQKIGLPATGRREWLLDIDFGKRETFAYACEVYSRILELGRSTSARRELLSHREKPCVAERSGRCGEYINILHAAVAPEMDGRKFCRTANLFIGDGHFDEPDDMM